MLPKLVKAYRGENCLELSLEAGGAIYEECKCGSLHFSTNSRGRVVCCNCGKYAKLTSNISCALCGDGDIGEVAEEVKALLLPDGTLQTIEDYLIICEEVGKPTTMLFWVF